MTMLAEVTKNGVTVEVNVDSTGTFTCAIADDQYSADTMANLVKQIDAATKKIAKAVAVPVTVIDFNRGGLASVNDGTATGLHSGTGNVLITWATGVKEQLTHWNVPGEIFRPLTKNEINEYVRLHGETIAAREAETAWVAAHRINVKQDVIAALKAGADGTN